MYPTRSLALGFHLVAVLLGATIAPSLSAAEQAKPRTLFTNVHVFDGVNEKRIENANVRVEGSLIKEVSRKPIDAAGATVIDGGGRTLTPGFIDPHTHIMVNESFEPLIYDRTQVDVGALATVNATVMLHRGFTTIRDVGGPSQGLKDVIDRGLIEGPRILSSGSFISQSSGHGDFDSRMTYLSPHFTGQVDKAEIFGWTKVADGVPEVTKAVRENFRSGATQIKIMGSGSVTGAHDPLDVTEYTLEELHAIVKEAAKWGTYATSHA